MIVAIVWKAFNNHNNNLTIDSSNYISILNKFTLKTFYWLCYNREISGLLVIGYLLNLPDHYFAKTIVKIINITLLQAKFLWILNNTSFNQSDNIVHFDSTKI